MGLPQTELIHCKCGHEFEAFHNDLGTYMCPECFQKDDIQKVKPLDTAFKLLETKYPEWVEYRKRTLDSLDGYDSRS